MTPGTPVTTPTGHTGHIIRTKQPLRPHPHHPTRQRTHSASKRGPTGDRTMTLHITWPIEDPDAASLKQCKAEAMADLRETLSYNGLVATSGPIFEISHGANPHITVEIAVTYAQNAAFGARRAA